MPRWRRSRRTTTAVWWGGGRGTKTAGYLAKSSNKTCPQNPARSVNYRWLLIKISASKIPDTAEPGNPRHAMLSRFICVKILSYDCRVRVSGGLLQGFWILAVSASRSGFSRPPPDRKQQARFGQTRAAASGCAHTWRGAVGLQSSHTSRSVHSAYCCAEFALEEACTCHSSPRSLKH